MKITQFLFKHHIGRMTQFNWYAKGRIKVVSTATEEVVKSHGYEVVDVKEFLNLHKNGKKATTCIDVTNKELQKHGSSRNYECEPCYIYKDNDVLIDGLQQAKVLTNAVEISEGLPEIWVEEENKLNLSDDVHMETKNKIILCCMFDATQEKLPRRKDPLKPMWIFPRDFGIPESRRNELLCKNLAVLCEQFGKNVKNKSVILDAFFSCPVEAHKKQIQFEVSSELLITTRTKLKAPAKPSLTHNCTLPELYPIDCTVSLNPYYSYVMQNRYPPGTKSKWPFIQFAFIHLNYTQVKNSIEEELTESQIQGRSLLKGFSMALAEARAVFGEDIKKLPEPVVVPLVQSDGKMFHFTVFQLNTLDLNKDSRVKNIFWNSQRIPLYSKCEYQAGRPVLEGYNPDVIRKLITFYNIE